LGAFELLITDGDHDIREAAIDIIADYRLTGAIPLLRAALNDPHPAVRGAAAQALENLAP
jgi:HEAT repeat protein